VAAFVDRHFIPVKIHVKQQPATFQRFGVQWTPVLLVLDPNGKEQHRWEGYLPADEFLAQLELGVAKVAFGTSRWDDATALFDRFAREHPDADLAPVAVYWAGVSRYKRGDASALRATAEELRRRFPGSEWARKSSVWLPADAPAPGPAAR
jgi:hypothetical protein